MAMSSLAPGILFKNSGLNQRHTPTNITASSEQVKTKYRRSSIPEGGWPPESPVAKIYDIRNSSSRLIILNNKMEKKSHLRAKSGRYKSSSDSGEDKGKGVSPERHLWVSMTRSNRHDMCHDSKSPKFQPTPSRPLSSDSPRRVPSRRYPATSGSAVPSEWHHYSSQVDRGRASSAPLPRRGSARIRKLSIEPPPCFSQDKRWLQHPDMTYGQKKYMNSIACTYDITDMKQLKQAQYLQLIQREKQRALYFFTAEEYAKYLVYLNSERNRQFKSKPPPATHYKTNDKKDKPKNKPKNSSRKKSVNSTESIDAESIAEEEKKQSAPKPVRRRSQSSRAQSPPTQSPPTQSPPTCPVDSKSKEDNRVSDKQETRTTEKATDDTEYMMYSNPENPKQEKTTNKRSSRPKSSKYRHRQPSPKERTISSSSSDHVADDKESTIVGSVDDEEDKVKYWQQPAPPIRESEPDGNGLTMSEGGHLQRDNDAIEEGHSEQSRERTERRPTAAAEEDNSKDVTDDGTTYDIEHNDGTKTRVYAPPIEQARRDDDIPVLKEEQEEAST